MEEKLELKDKETSELMQSKRRFYDYFVEIYTWLVAGIVISFSIWGFNFDDDSILFKITSFSLGFVFFPLVFKLVFSKLPIEYIRFKFLVDKSKLPNIVIDAMIDPDYDLKSRMFLAHNVQECKMNSERLFSQSRIYLLFGCFIALGGVVVFFYLGNGSVWGKYLDEIMLNNKFSSVLGLKIMEYLPRFGILFFIEYIAFFFLKQYRILMEEYRYYESIKRQRQDVLSLYLLIQEYSNNPEILNIIVDYIDRHSTNVPKMTSSDKIKAEKIVNADFDLISKITSMIQAIKSSNK